MAKVSSDIISLREQGNEALLKQVYEELYLPNFFVPEEQEEMEQYRQRLFEPQMPPPQPITHFLVAGKQLQAKKRRYLHGFIIVELYRASACALITYVAVSPSRRRQGVGKLLVSAARAALARTLEQMAPGTGVTQPRAIFAEAHNPHRVDAASEPIDPRERLRTLARLGAQVMPFHYVQPELTPEAGRSRNLLFLTFPSSETRSATPIEVDANVVQQFLHEFYEALQVSNVPHDPDYLAMSAEIAGGVSAETAPDIRQTAREVAVPLAKLVVSSPYNQLAAHSN